MDFFTSSDLQRLFHNRFVVVIGDSVERGMYKDLVYLLQNNKYMEDYKLKKKCEVSFHGDELIEGGVLGRLHNGKDMREVRQYKTDTHLVRYYYITRCYSDYMETILLDMESEPRPDLILMGSCVWDITRYGPKGFDQYQKNLQRLFKRLKEVIPQTCLFLWLTTLPIGSDVHGGFMLDELSFYNETLRFDVVVSNFYAKQVVDDHDFSVLDLHHHFRELTYWRQKDGIHWNVYAHRRITQMILTFVCEAWRIKLPHRNPSLRNHSGELLSEYSIHPNDKQAMKVKARRQRSFSCQGNLASSASNHDPNMNSNTATNLNLAAQMQQQSEQLCGTVPTSERALANTLALAQMAVETLAKDREHDELQAELGWLQPWASNAGPERRNRARLNKPY